MSPQRRAPSKCPVCGGQLAITRLSCGDCGTEVVGDFGASPFAALDAADLELVRVFLASRGNLREVQQHLGVSYPTARARFTALLARLGLAQDRPTRDELLEQVANGELSPDEAAELLS
jgi:hypothetical protein